MYHYYQIVIGPNPKTLEQRVDGQKYSAADCYYSFSFSFSKIIFLLNEIMNIKENEITQLEQYRY
jgi:hypothetical protein